MRIPVSVRLEKYSVQSGECLLWTGATYHDGYGRIMMGDVSNRKVMRAHRVAYEQAFGPIPDGAQVLHRCDKPACIRVDHLFLGSISDNSKDMLLKGRSGRAKLKPGDISKLRAMRKSGKKLSDVAKEFGIQTSTASRICSGALWNFLEANQ